jgi:cytidine deaminase
MKPNGLKQIGPTRARLTADERRLVAAAKIARTRAHAHQSQFKVGAAARYGKEIVLGCNVESDVYGLTNCAERTAVFAAHASGVAGKGLKMIAVIADTPEPVTPCGACRQVLIEQGGPDLRVIMCNTRGDVRVATLAELLPGSFRLETTPKPRAAAAAKPRQATKRESSGESLRKNLSKRSAFARRRSTGTGMYVEVLEDSERRRRAKSRAQ